jgi:(S)-mandelate dehydrogenase
MHPRRLARIHSIEDFRRAARRALPKMLFDFVDGGSETENTVRENRAALDRIRLMPSGPVDVSKRRQSVSLFGKPATSPIIIGPTGLAGAFWPKGDLALAAAAERFGIPFVMSTNANSSLESVAAAGNGRNWFQLYARPDRAQTASLLDRVAASGFEAVEITVDTAVASRRLRDLHNGFGPTIDWTPSQVAGVLARPGWLLRSVRYGTPRPAVLDDEAEKRGETLAEKVSRILNASTTWDDIAWMRDHWKGILVIKGLSDPRQAERAVAVGLDGIVVSNHGGRQLDGAVGSIDALPEIVAAAGKKLAILVDGGFRTGTDIVKALALGAAAVQIGRPPIYALATAGEAGVSRALDILHSEIDVAQALLGVADLSNISTDALFPASRPRATFPSGAEEGRVVRIGDRQAISNNKI